MNLKQGVIILLLAAIVASDRISPGAQVNEQLLNFMIRSNNLIGANPARSAECFNQYIQSIDELAKSYQRSFDGCIQASEDARSEAEAATLDKRNALASKAKESCNLLSQCSEIESAENVFQCYVQGGSVNGKTMYLINVDASEYSSALQEEFRLVQNKEDLCTNNAKRQYEKDTIRAYEKFNKCNLGITEEPPEASTEEPENPESTEAPVETVPTEEPEAPAETEPTEEPEASENTENPEGGGNPFEAKLPEEDLSLRQWLRSGFNLLRLK